MQRFFHSELQNFRTILALMGERSVESVRSAVRSLREHDFQLAEEVLRQDTEIDQLEMKIDAEALRYLTLRSPVAQDLRLIMVGMKMGHDLERVGDEACSIAKRTKRVCLAHPVPSMGRIPEMSELALTLLREAIDSFLDGQENAARAILPRDKEVDALNRQIATELSLSIQKNPQITPIVLDLIFVAKSLERIADHATNIAEEVIFLRKGWDVRHLAEMKTSNPLPAVSPTP